VLHRHGNCSLALAVQQSLVLVQAFTGINIVHRMTVI
jgi:hypothetical protein